MKFSGFKRWYKWQSSSTNRQIFLAMLIVVGMTGTAKVVVAAREIVVVGYFGISEVVDAFLIAYVLPMFALGVIAGSFSAAMMPSYIHTRQELGVTASKALFSSILVLVILLLVVTTGVLAILLPIVFPLIGAGFSEETKLLSVSLFYWLLPVLVLSGISQLYATALNAVERFAVVALAPAITPICTISFIVVFMNDWGIYALAGGALLGAMIELVVLVIAASRHDVPCLPRWGGITNEIRDVLGQYVPMLAGSFLMSGTVLVDQAMAATLAPGSVAALNYANKVISIVLSIGAMALGTAVLPHFSRMVVNKDWISIRHTFKTYFKLAVIVSVPITAVFFFFSDLIVETLFERGAFGSEDTKQVSQIQMFYALQIPFYILGILAVRLISSLKSNYILMYGAAISLPLNIALNYVFMQWFGVSGIALSTACVYLVSFIFLTSMLAKELPKGIVNEK